MYLSDSEVRTLESSYYTKLSDGTWVRNFNADLGSLAMKQLYGFFYEKGKYTDEELIADLEAQDAPAENYPTNPGGNSLLRLNVKGQLYLGIRLAIVRVTHIGHGQYGQDQVYAGNSL